MKICKNKGKTTNVDIRQGNMWYLRNGSDRKTNASKAGMTKGGKQLPMTSRAKPAPETEDTCGETGPRNGGHLRKAPVTDAAGAAARRSASAE